MNIWVTAASPFFEEGLLKSKEDDFFYQSLLRMVNSYSSSNGKKVLILRDTCSKLSILDFLRELSWECQFVTATKGALPTAMVGVADAPSEEPILVAPGDSYVLDGYESAIQLFLESPFDGYVPTIQAEDDSWSYVRYFRNNRISEIAEKRKISREAATGAFIFRNKMIFLTQQNGF